ncbi:MAG: hypothetical protein RIB98_12120 [Acidimicrobiales bacterium]
MRRIEHTAFVRRSYADVCWLLDRHSDEILELVGTAASERSAAIVEAADDTVPGFDEGHEPELAASPFVRDDNHARLDFTWEGNATKRLLVSVDIHLDIRPLVLRGPAATTEVTLRADYQPPVQHRRSPETALFGRRVVRAALHELLEAFVRRLEDFEESPFGRTTTSP